MAYYGESEYILAYPDEDVCCSPSYDMYYKLGEYLSKDEVKLLVYLMGNIFDENTKSRIHCGRDLFLAMEEQNICREDVMRRIGNLLKIINRHDVVPHLHTTGKRKAAVDPLEEYMKESKTRSNTDSESPSETFPKKRKAYNTNHTAEDRATNEDQCISQLSQDSNTSLDSTAGTTCEIKRKYTCDVRLRVRAEYCSHESVLNDSVSSNRNHPFERQLENFVLANNVLRVRDLGYIVCDIKFSEITYLDAFWRDYLNGSLLEALKDVFITESLKQAVGEEAIKLLVHVDEEDYERGRLTLLQNLDV